jgi:hypothetical protein
MTFRRDLKRRIRERQERTGERYTTARAHVLGSPDDGPGSLVIELQDVSDIARALGLRCVTRVTPDLRSHAEALLGQLLQILRGPTAGLEPMRRVALEGEPERSTGSTVLLMTHIRAFVEQLRQGLRGPGPGGRLLAFEAALDGQSRPVIAQLLPRYRQEAILAISRFGEQAILFEGLDRLPLVRP